jgi:hypothetical protein
MNRSKMLTLVMLAAAAMPAAASASEDLAPYRAVYRVERDGELGGRSEWTLSYEAAHRRYRFVSSTTAEGPLKLVAPKPVVETADFEYDNGAIVPLTFSYEDGTRSGERSFRTTFDWAEGQAYTAARGYSTQVEIDPGVLDPITAQVILMRDLATEASRLQTGLAYRFVDGESIGTLSFSKCGSELVSSAQIETWLIEQRREGSSRRTRLWLAPELGFLPIKIEIDDGLTASVFTLEYVEIDGKRSH